VPYPFKNCSPPKDDKRRVVIESLTVVFKDHKEAVLKFTTEDEIKNAKKHPLVIKEGCFFKFRCAIWGLFARSCQITFLCKKKKRVSFRVQHNVVLGLQIKNTVSSKLGVKLAEDTEMLGTYPPKNEFQAVDIPKHDWNEAPSGMLGRGEYKAHMKFVDDDGACHLDFEYLIKISKDWKDE